MTGVMKKGLGLLVLVFVVFYMFTDPNGLASVAKQAGAQGWDLLVQLFGAAIRFLNAMLS